MEIRNHRTLIKVYRAIEKYQLDHHGRFPSFRELVEAGVVSSTDNVGYCFQNMEALEMIHYERKTARSSYLLPISAWSPVVREIYEAQDEWQAE